VIRAVRYMDNAWATLALTQRIEPPEIHRLVRDWPEDTCIEVRSCASCAGPIAATRSFRAGANTMADQPEPNRVHTIGVKGSPDDPSPAPRR
jgi:hypothetical protein